MNIICNNCVGARIYQQLRIAYNNPFIWCRIYYDSFRKIITNYNNINFTNFYFDDTYTKDGCKNHIIIDNDIELNYTHYIQNSKYNTPTNVGGLDIYYNNIKKYTIEKYEKRISRLTHEKNICILCDYKNGKLTIDNILDFLNLNIDDVKILVTNRKYDLNYNKTNVLITKETNTKNIANLILQKYKNIFVDFKH